MRSTRRGHAQLVVIALAFLGGALLCGPLLANGTIEVVSESRPAKPITIVSPDFPEASTAPAGGVRVDVQGTVQFDGTLHPARVTAEGGHDAFVNATQQVLKYWRFEPALDLTACSPWATEVAFSFWFEGSTKEPRVFLSYPRATVAKSTPTNDSPLENLDGPQVKFPPALLEVEGKVTVLYRIDSAGKIASVSILSSTPYGVFDSLVLANARRTTAVWKTNAKPQAMCVIRPFRFCVEGFAPRFPHNECKR